MSNWLDTIAEDNYWNDSKQSGFSFEDELDDQPNQSKFDVSVPTISKPKADQIETIPKSIVKVNKNDRDIEALKVFPRLTIKHDATQTFHCDLNRIIREIINGHSYYLHHIKSKENKIRLLDLAIDSCDGDAIITIILFMKQTLNSKIFKNEISNRSEAINHYINYLKLTNQWIELSSFQSMLDRSDDAAITAYSQAIKPKLLASKITNLKRCRDMYCNSLNSNSELKYIFEAINEQVNLLERQQPIESEDKKTEETQLDPTSIFVQVPRTCLLNKSVISTLKYCYMYHFNVPNTFFASPDAIKNAYSLNSKQYTWTCLRAVAECQRWQDVDKLFETKTILGGKKMKSIIPWFEVVKILHKNEAPTDLIIKYLSLIEDGDLKISLAKEYKFHNLVLELCVNLRDRQTLQQYIPKLKPNSQEFFYAQDILKQPSIKWKN